MKLAAVLLLATTYAATAASADTLPTATPTTSPDNAPSPPPSQPYHGGPIPPGAQVRMQMKKPFVIGGFVLLGVAYVGAGFIAGNLVEHYTVTTGPGSRCASDSVLGAVPFVGAVTSQILLASNSQCSPVPSAALFQTLGTLATLAQIAGLTLGIYGAVKHEPFLVYAQRRTESPGSEWSLSIVPGAATAGNGLTLVAQF